MKNLDKIAFEFWAGVGSMSDLENWAESELRKDNPHPDACELFGLSTEEAQKRSIALAEEILGFKPVSEQGEKLAKELLVGYCEKLIKKEITPMKFCLLVQLFDANYLGLRTLGDGSLEYPAWLGNLWNNCDWCDESWSLSSSPHLLEEAKKVIKNET